MIAFELTLLDAALCHGINTRTWERRGLVDLVTKRFICMYDHAVPWVHSLQLCKPFVQCLMWIIGFKYLRWKHAKVLAGWVPSESHHAWYVKIARGHELWSYDHFGLQVQVCMLLDRCETVYVWQGVASAHGSLGFGYKSLETSQDLGDTTKLFVLLPLPPVLWERMRCDERPPGELRTKSHLLQNSGGNYVEPLNDECICLQKTHIYILYHYTWQNLWAGQLRHRRQQQDGGHAVAPAFRRGAPTPVVTLVLQQVQGFLVGMLSSKTQQTKPRFWKNHLFLDHFHLQDFISACPCCMSSSQHSISPSRIWLCYKLEPCQQLAMSVHRNLVSGWAACKWLCYSCLACRP